MAGYWQSGRRIDFVPRTLVVDIYNCQGGDVSVYDLNAPGGEVQSLHDAAETAPLLDPSLTFAAHNGA